MVHFVDGRLIMFYPCEIIKKKETLSLSLHKYILA